MDKFKEQANRISVNLHDYRRAFLYKDLKALRATYYIFYILRYPWMVAVLTRLTRFALFFHLPVRKLIRATIYRTFCAGETTDEAIATIKRLDWYNVSAVLDYVSEGETSQRAFDHNKRVIILNIHRMAAEAPGNSISIKLTGLEDPVYLEKISGLPPASLKGEELARYRAYEARVDEICAACAEKGVAVYMDAEDRCMQDGFDLICCCMMARYNREKAVVYNTLQMYLKDSLVRLHAMLNHAARHGYYAGIKLVRGAYVEKERARAERLGMSSPVHENKPATDAAFNEGLKLCLERSSYVYTCVASHNEKSTLYGLQLIDQLGIRDHRQKVKFCQLYGMSDHLTFNLSARGLSASKYIPYGEVEKAVPYLIRRAEENTSIGGQMPKELSILREELRRRSHHQAVLEQ